MIMDDQIASDAERIEYIGKAPRVSFQFGRSEHLGPGFYAVGIYWDKDIGSLPGMIIYRRWWIFRWYWRLNLRFWFDRA